MLFFISSAICAVLARLKGDPKRCAAAIDDRAKSVARKMSKMKTIRKEWKSEGNWLRFGVVTYVDGAGKEHTYETVERTTTRGPLDGVDVLAYIESAKLNGKHVVLVLSYRPPVGRVCIEFPAGLVDAGETPEVAAVRELNEETGFVGTCTGAASRALDVDPWKSTENTALVTVRIDGDEKTNDENLTDLGKKKNLEDEEFLDVLLVPFDGMLETILRCARENDFGIDSKLYTFALALDISKNQ